MSVSLFNVLPVEVLYDEKNQPWFKRADLGRYLRIAKIAESYRDILTISRHEIGLVSNQPQAGQNDHDAFVSLDSALEITVRSKKPRAVALIKLFIKNGIEKIQEEHQLAITDRNDRIQAIQYDNVVFQAQRDVYREQVTDLIAHRHVPRCGDIDTVLVVVEKNMPDEGGKPAQHPYYMIRCQKKCLNAQIKILRIKYPDMIMKESVCNDANSIHAWSRFKQDILEKNNYYLNHFSLPEESRELFEGMFGIEI